MINWIRNALVNWLRYKPPISRTSLSDFERISRELKPADIVLVEGRSRVSQVIKLITQSRWSHAALYIGRPSDIEDDEIKRIVASFHTGPAEQQLIIESEIGRGTVVRPLNVYRQEHLRICRPRGLQQSDAQHVIHQAVGRLGSSYDVRQILDLARFLFPWTLMPRRWRSSLFSANPGRSTHTVCSTMIAEAFAHIQFPILPLIKRVAEDRVQLFMRNPRLCTPSDFDYSPYFDIIKYPFVDFADSGDQRLLPWQGSGVLTEDERDLYLSGTVVDKKPEDPRDI